MEVDVNGDVEAECQCPFCKKYFTTTIFYVDTVDIDLSDLASDGFLNVVEESEHE